MSCALLAYPSTARALDCGVRVAPELQLICIDDLLRPQHEAFMSLQRAAVQYALLETAPTEPRNLRELLANRGADREALIELYDREIWSMTRRLAKLAPGWPGGIYTAVTKGVRIEALVVPIESWPPYVDLRVRSIERVSAGTRVSALFADRGVALGYETPDCELTLQRDPARPASLGLRRFGTCRKARPNARFDRAVSIPAQIDLLLAHD